MDTQKQQIVERLQQANNVLVTVSANPSVDQLAAAIGFTLLLNKLGKHATAVFSGNVPSTIEFLEPEQTLEKNTDSLRDFIIALDKSKADKLRYKVEDQMVKIFITPYRTSISDKDLEFSQGDFNVEVVVALGVHEQQDLDQAIVTHGRILHDATVISVSTDAGSNLGAINWTTPDVSSLCEMLVSLGLALKDDVLDAQMATAFLTGIVAETDRFSNEKTSSATMQVSGQLMAAGANQQLVASKLQQPNGHMGGGSAEPAEREEAEHKESKTSPDGSLEIEHDGDGPESEEVEEEPAEPEIEQIHIDESGNLNPATPETPDETAPDTEKSEKEGSRLILEPPTLGGKLTANTEPEALDPSIDPMGLQAEQGPILSHDKVGGNEEPSAEESKPAEAPEESQEDKPAEEAPEEPAPKSELESLPPIQLPSLQDVTSATSSTDDVVQPGEAPLTPEEPTQEAPTQLEVSEQGLPEAPQLGGEEKPNVDAARAAVQQALASSPPTPEPIAALNAQPIDLNSPVPEVTQPSEVAPVLPQVTAPEPGNTNIDIDPVSGQVNFPSNLVPPQPTPPIDPTATGVINPTSPPPVPPPMMPPVMPPSNQPVIDPSAPPSNQLPGETPTNLQTPNRTLLPSEPPADETDPNAPGSQPPVL